jgi:hypothetical protein
MDDLIEVGFRTLLHKHSKESKNTIDTLHDYIYKHFVSSSGYLIKSDFVVCYRFLALGHTVSCSQCRFVFFNNLCGGTDKSHWHNTDKHSGFHLN